MFSASPSKTSIKTQAKRSTSDDSKTALRDVTAVRDRTQTFGVSGWHRCVRRALTRGSIGTIPETVETDNTQSCQGGGWLMRQSTANQSRSGSSLLFGKMQGDFEKMQRGANCTGQKAAIS